jgi:hypothetical protein
VENQHTIKQHADGDITCNTQWAAVLCMAESLEFNVHYSFSLPTLLYGARNKLLTDLSRPDIGPPAARRAGLEPTRMLVLRSALCFLRQVGGHVILGPSAWKQHHHGCLITFSCSVISAWFAFRAGYVMWWNMHCHLRSGRATSGHVRNASHLPITDQLSAACYSQFCKIWGK